MTVVEEGKRDSFGMVSLDWMSKTKEKRDGLICGDFMGLYSKNKSSIDVIAQDENNYLRKRNKIRLVLDLDETLVHTVSLGEFANPKPQMQVKIQGNCMEYEWKTTKKVKKQKRKVPEILMNSKNGRIFELDGLLYKVFARPGLIQFLTKIYKDFDVFVYTHGTTVYAKRILRLLGVDHLISGVFGRYNKYERRRLKDLQQICCSNNMSIVIDDRKDVWSKKDHRNVLQVTAWTGDIKDNELFHVHCFLSHVKKYFYDYNRNDVRGVIEHYISHLERMNGIKIAH